MKVIRNNKIYIQKKDLKYLYKTKIPTPEIIEKIIVANNIDFNNQTNNYDYIYYSDNIEAIYLNDLYFLIDYDEYYLLGLKQVHNLIENLTLELSDIALQYLETDQNEIKVKLKIKNHHDNLIYKIKDIFYVEECKKNNIPLPTPKIEKQNIKTYKKTT